jgi:hypothetical protein
VDDDSGTLTPEEQSKLKLHSFRTMKDSIKLEIPHLNAEGGWLVDYQPGNMTKYLVFFQKINSSLSKEMGMGLGATMIVFANMPNRPTLILPEQTGYLSLDYFMEKTGIREGDAIPLVRLVRNRLKLEGS